MSSQSEAIQKLMNDGNFRAFVSHPKVQALFRDPEFRETAKSRDFGRIVMHPKFAELAKDPEVSQLLFKINPQNLAN